MRKLRDNEFADRRSAAADAKTLLLNAYRAAKENAEPRRLARQAESVSRVEARELRRAERDRLKLEERTRREATAAEEKATAAAAVAETEAREKSETARIARLVGDEAERKAERDRRYAARKARQV